jgi:hypothetical protein
MPAGSPNITIPGALVPALLIATMGTNGTASAMTCRLNAAPVVARSTMSTL